MKDNKNIKGLVEETLEEAGRVESVSTPPYFKERTLNAIFRPEELAEKQPGLAWFAPKLQVALLIFLVVVNSLALIWYSSGNYDQNVENFAEAYGLSEDESESYYNLN